MRRAGPGLILGLVLGLLAPPLVAWAAEPAAKVARVGVLWPNPPATFEFFRQGLRDVGYVEGQNITFEYRWAEGALHQLPELAAGLVRLNVDAIVTLAPPATVAAKNATQTIPIVFVAMGDPVASGVVPSLARPGGNLTGTTRMLPEMSVKHLELLKEAVPAASRVAVLWNPTNSSHGPALRAVEATAQALRVQLRTLEVRGPDELDAAFGAVTKERARGLLFLADPIFFIHLRRVADFVASNRLPAVSNFTEFPKLGGLMGYAPSISEEFRRAGHLMGKILKGAKPADLPVEQPTRFELVINLKTARALGLTIPPSVLVRVDQVIQ